MIMFHVNLQGCRWFRNLVSKIVKIGSLCRCLSLTISFRHPKLPRPYEIDSIKLDGWSGFYTRNFSINDAVAIKLGLGLSSRKITGRNEADILGAENSHSMLHPPQCAERRPCSLIDLSWFPILLVKSLLHSLVGGLNPSILVTLDHFARGENKKRLKPPPSIILIPY